MTSPDDMQVRCCEVTHVMGFELREGVILVGASSLLISVVAVYISVTSLFSLGLQEGYNSNPVLAINLLFALFCTPTSIYQLFISLILMTCTLWGKESSFVLSLWFGSQITLMTLYGFMFTARIVIFFHAREFVLAMCNFLIAAFYYFTSIYFAIIVKSYSNSIQLNVIFY